MAAERLRAMPKSVLLRHRAERLEGVLREIDALLQGAKLGCLRAGYPGSVQAALFRLEAARDKARAVVEALDEGTSDE